MAFTKIMLLKLIMPSKLLNQRLAEMTWLPLTNSVSCVHQAGAGRGCKYNSSLRVVHYKVSNEHFNWILLNLRQKSPTNLPRKLPV